MFGLGVPELLILVVVVGVPVALVVALRRRKRDALPPGVNVTVNTGGAADGAKARDVVTEMERLHALKEKGALTEEEFAAQKQRLLSG